MEEESILDLESPAEALEEVLEEAFVPLKKRKWFSFKLYKKRAKKQIGQWLIIGAVSIFILGFFTAADALAAASYADISGASNDLAPVTDGDAGVMDFTDSADPPTESYKAQLYSTGQPDDFEIRGWVWDANLGWVSLYCDENGQNLGRDCGSIPYIPYGVKVDISNNGELTGWAWGENIGWISFSCRNGLNQGHECGGVNYRNKLNIHVDNDLGKITSFGDVATPAYAWADTVGWFELQTVRSNILPVVVQENTAESQWGVWTKGEIADDGLTATEKDAEPTKNTMPVADGTDGYDIFVHVSDITGTPVLNGGGITVDIETDWTDSVQFDQTVEPLTTDFNLSNTGPVQKPGVQNSGGYELIYNALNPTTGGFAQSYGNVANSIAPTDGGNCFDGDGDGSCYTGEDNWFYRKFGEDITDQKITYTGATVTITKAGPPLETATFILNPLGGAKVMEFLPLIEIPTLNFMLPGDPPKAVNIIQATRNKEDVFEIQGALNSAWGGDYSIELELLHDDPTNIFYQFVRNLASVPVAGAVTPLTFNKPRLPIGKYYAIPFAPDVSLAEEISGAMIRSTINLPGEGVSYFNNGLPRTADSVILNQAAQIVSGSVFSPGAKEATTAEVPLFGDTAVYKLRTQILEDVSSLVRGVDTVGDGSEIVVRSANATELANYALKDGRVYYFNNRDVRIRNLNVLTNIEPDRPITIIVEGGDIYVDSNIDTGNAIGLIALESRTDSSQATGGGHIYVRDNVTDMINVSIFADGPMFRYDSSVCFYWGNDGTGEPSLRAPNYVTSAGWCSSPGTSGEPISSFPNQFYLLGNAATLNCIGCSIGAQPIRGDNKKLGAPTPENYAVARLYDLNYFSYYREDLLNPGTYPGNESTAVQAHPTISNKNFPVYFEYAPAPNDLLGFRTF
ncbi:hypothetical protein ACFLZH_05950 [Patescibacteria group bacterium]